MKIYVPEELAQSKIAMATIASLPDEYLTIAARIILEAEVLLHNKLHSYLLIELAELIHFAVTRLHEQLILHKQLLWEIQIAVEPAFRMGEWALTEIE